MQLASQEPTTTTDKPMAAAARSTSSRRPRVREVSSRFMSPVVSSSSSGDLHLPSSSSFSSSSSKCPPPLPKHPHHPLDIRQQQQQRSQSVHRRHPSPSSPIHSDSESEPLCSSNSNTVFDTPSAAFHPSKALPRRSAKLLLKENGDPLLLDSSKPPSNGTHLRSIATKFPAGSRKRTDTPTVFFNRPTPRSMFTIQNIPRSTSSRVASAASTAAAKLVQSSGMGAKRNAIQEMSSIHGNPVSAESSDNDVGTLDVSADNSVSSDSSSEMCTISGQGGVCDSPPIPAQTSKIRPISDFRSSMPEADLLPTMSARLLGEGNSSEVVGSGDLCRVSASPCYRSLNSALSSCQQSFSPTKSICKSSVFTKSHLGPTKPGIVCLPPNPSNMKPGIEARKGRKASSHQEDVHSLRMLHNRCLQWRLANAKAEATMNAQQIEAELPYLDEWAVLDGDYSNSVSGAIKALQDASLQLPVVGNVRADTTELNDAFNSVTNVLEAIFPFVQSFLPKAEGVDHVISELARVVARERALIEECGDLLSKVHVMQVEECSLRGQLIQLKRSSSTEPKEV
ncbi:protein ENDOSPERM DEFECTIVE 1-like isoform X2 [Magnolia sinica]|uniref:protein ENDOSPERM DEFECTIVE 1-like isoform X2 n=1 Tax=Magnolia sinica TaxID=86752 RepID=UPI00265B25FB|nr:protein ENDOSPERM DEFECTIVE 1-like isoform X2 [Magnolia sinica]